MWVFHGNGGRFTSGVYSSRERAEDWIAQHGLSGMLTAYPLDQGVYDWATLHGTFRVKRDEHRPPDFIGTFSSAYQEHAHYEHGRCVSDGA